MGIGAHEARAVRQEKLERLDLHVRAVHRVVHHLGELRDDCTDVGLALQQDLPRVDEERLLPALENVVDLAITIQAISI